MIDSDNNFYIERDYDGYGVFGGKDYYALLDEMNGGSGDRDRGIDLYHNSTDPNTLFPNLIEVNSDRELEQWQWRNEKPEDCEYQGFFY